MIYSGVFMTILYGADLLCRAQSTQWLLQHAPLALAAPHRARPSFPWPRRSSRRSTAARRLVAASGPSYGKPSLYSRGVVVGLGVGYAVLQSLPAQDMLARVEFGFAAGMAAFAGVSLLRDGVYAMRRRGRLQWRVYLVESLWGGLIGAAAGFYLDAAQVSLVVDKFHRYLVPERRRSPSESTPS